MLRDVQGERFMPAYHAKAELAPRDVVARAIVERMEATGADHVLLDVTHLERSHVIARFPQIYRFCLDAGLDITREPIPVSPAAHYTMGGIRTNVWGETTLPGLYACGECACTGVHGANRLASNSLLETVVFARRVVQRTVGAPGGSAADTAERARFERGGVRGVRAAHAGGGAGADVGGRGDRAGRRRVWRERRVRWGRGTRRLGARARATLASPLPIGRRWSCGTSCLCSRLVAEAALLREESRGAHYRTDFPESRDEWRRHSYSGATTDT